MAKKEMKLSGKDVRHLMFMERWATYSTSTGALSLERIIRADDGNNFSSILGKEDIYVRSFDMKNIPKANILLVFGVAPRAIAYAAEIAIRHFDQYGYYPEFVAAGDGRGMFKHRVDMATWFENMMIALGFDKEWIKLHHISQREKNRDMVAEIKQKIDGIFCRKKPVVLAITDGGNSLCIAQKLPVAMQNIDFCFFEPKQLDIKARLFDGEVFDQKCYAVDKLLANVVLSQIIKKDVLPLPIEKKLYRPENRYIRDLVLRGYAGFFNNPQMFLFVEILPSVGHNLYKERVVQLQEVSRLCSMREQTKILLWRINRSLADKGLVIK